MDQIVQALGSLLILTAFIAAQRRWVSTAPQSYLVLNLVGASVLTVLAADERQYELLGRCRGPLAAGGFRQPLRHSLLGGSSETLRG